MTPPNHPLQINFASYAGTTGRHEDLQKRNRATAQPRNRAVGRQAILSSGLLPVAQGLTYLSSGAVFFTRRGAHFPTPAVAGLSRCPAAIPGGSSAVTRGAFFSQGALILPRGARPMPAGAWRPAWRGGCSWRSRLGFWVRPVTRFPGPWEPSPGAAGSLPQPVTSSPPYRGIVPASRGLVPPRHGFIPPCRGPIPPRRGTVPTRRGIIPPRRGTVPPALSWAFSPSKPPFSPRHGVPRPRPALAPFRRRPFLSARNHP